MRIHSQLVFKLLFLLLVLFVCLSLVAHQYISNMMSSDTQPISHKTRQIESYSDTDGDPNPRPMSAYQHEIEELRHIKASVNNELRDLENKRLRLQQEISSYSTHIDNLKAQHVSLSKDVNQIKLALEQLKFEQEESRSYIPSIRAPHRIIMDTDPSETLASPTKPQACHMESCFDFSRCSLVSGFPVYFYNPAEFFLGKDPVNEDLVSSFVEYFKNNVYRTSEASKACIFIALLGDFGGGGSVPAPTDIQNLLAKLPYWGGDGRNHILLYIASSPQTGDLFKSVDTGRAIVAQSSYTGSVFRDKFDVLIPPNFGPGMAENVWRDIPLLIPMRRKILLSYWGQFVPPEKSSLSFGQNKDRDETRNNQDFKNDLHIQRKPQAAMGSIMAAASSSSSSLYSHIEKAIVSSLKSFQSSHLGNFFIDVSCSPHGIAAALPADWALCGTEEDRIERTLQSTFTLIISSLNSSLDSTASFQTKLYETLKHGSIPVILGSHGHLPYSEVLHWDTAAIVLPTPRVTEIPFYLQSFSDEAISALRLQGRMFFQNYFGSTQSILDSLLAVIRSRLQIPAKPVRDEPSPSVFPASFTPLRYDGPDPEPESDEVLGPIESPFPSEMYRNNFSQSFLWDSFNTPGDPFSLYPFTPFEPLLPSEAKFKGSSFGFRPVGKGAGGDGKDFGEALGGNVPREQFTIVMLTYDREVVLMQALHRFKGLPFLNKVVVVWNAEVPPSVDLRWPDIGVPIKVLKTSKNSLNNRFLPYSAIETEAVLSIDDDAHLRHDEIVFGFSFLGRGEGISMWVEPRKLKHLPVIWERNRTGLEVWREERSRIVGFPGRFHAWDLKHHSWNYNSNYSCELSMVLTGAAFFHKYYAYLYSYSMPQAVRDKVDEYMNCEDIAMNFLVAHITRRPPVKVTSRWTFRCPGCPTTLSSNSSHFEERHQCINFFSQVYGYTPLLYTQYRVDSVLFKTRIAHDKTKCFKYI